LSALVSLHVRKPIEMKEYENDKMGHYCPNVAKIISPNPM
jgi:hypothetical protein